MYQARGFSLVELAAMVVVVAVAASLLAATSEEQQDAERKWQAMTQARGIHQSLVMYAQGNKGWFAGIDGGTKAVVAPTAAERHEILLKGNYFTSEYAISPGDADKVPWQHGERATTDNISFAMLRIADPEADAGRVAEWSETLNTEAPVMSDRNTAADGEQPKSIWSEGEDDTWRGVVVWNDNHFKGHRSHVLESSKYSRWPINTDDHLFEAAGEADAMMVFDGPAAGGDE